MTEPRIDGSRSTATQPECDEETLVCGAQPKPEAQVSRPDPLVSHPDEDWHPPMLLEDKPSHLALVAKNMSAAKPQTGNPPVTEEGVKTNSVAHIGLTAEHDGVEAELALHKGKNVTVLEVGAQAGAQQVGPHAAVLHGHVETKIAGVDVSLSGDAGTVEYGPGVKNVDGSKGLHVGGNATTVGAELTVHKQGLGSVTVGASGGLAAEASVGLKKEDGTTEACGRVSAQWFTVGLCFPVWTTRN